MQQLRDELREAFEAAEYTVADVTTNRNQVRVEILDSEASAEDLRAITHEVVDESDTLGLNVSTESADSQAGVTTVVSFRYRG
jgi:SHS2 domain-containing protein